MRVLRGTINPALPLLLVLLGGSILPFTAVAAGSIQHGGPEVTTGHEVQAIESSATVEISGVTVNESVARAGDTVFVWEAGQNGSTSTDYRIDVRLPPETSDDYEVCLESDACRRAGNASGEQTVSVTHAAGAGNRTTVNLSLQRVSDGVVVDAATLSVMPIDREADLERDGVPNEREVEADTSLVLGDTDSDGLSDERELALKTDPTVADTDGDGLDDAQEVELETDPTVIDTDGDGLDDAREVELGTDPTTADTDVDGLSDQRELTLSADATVADTDGDGLADGDEVELGANLTTVDTDGDGLVDGREAALGSDPTVVDSDGDTLADAREVELGTGPTAVDTDGDGLADALEVDDGTDPAVADTDGDGLTDGREISLGSDPTVVDTDEDGLGDAREIEQGADPTVADTDGDYLADGTESEFGIDPTNPYTPALYASGLVGFLLGIGVAVSASEDGPVPWLSSVVPETLRMPTSTDSGPETTAPVTESARVVLDDRDEPAESSGASAREIFDRHQDALVTDAERTLRMLEAEGGQMRQSDIVDSTSWSKAKVSRLLSRMDDDEDIVKVSIGRENLICLPEQTPEPAQPTDPGSVSSAGVVSSAMGG